MALIGTLAINLTANTGRLSAGLNSSANQVDAWSSRVGSRVDSAFAGLATGGVVAAGKAANGLAGTLNKISTASKTARTALNFAVVGRYIGKATVAAGYASSAFYGWSQSGKNIRASMSELNGKLNTLGSVSKKVRKTLFWTDVGVIFAKLGTVFAGALSRMASGFVHVAAGVARTTVGLVGAVSGMIGATVSTAQFAGNLVMLGYNLGKVTLGGLAWVATLGKWGGAMRLIKSGAFNGFVAGMSAVFNGGSFLHGIGSVANGLRNMTQGLLQATYGVYKFGAGLVSLGVTAVKALLGGLVRTIKSVGTAFLSASASALGAAVKFSAIGGIIGGIIGVKLVRDASNLEESMNKVDVVFGKSGSSVVASAQKMQDAFGLSKRAFLDGASAFGGFFVGAGYAEKDAASLSVQMTKLAADMGSLRNIPVAEALTKIQAGLAGEAEPLRRFGVDLSDANVGAMALKMGLAQAGDELTASAKVQARISVITQGLAKDLGDLARTADSPSNAIKEFWGRVEDLSATFGESLLPVAAAALGGINTALVSLKEAWLVNKAAVEQWASSTAESLGLTGGGVSVLRKAVGSIADAWQMVRAEATKAFSYIADGLSIALAGLAKFFEGLSYVGGGEWATKFQKKLEEVSKSLEKGGKNLFKDFQDQLKQPLASKSVDDFFDKATKKIADARARLAAPIATKIEPPKGADVVAKDAASKKTGSEKAFSGAFKLGSVEAASTVLRSRYGASGKDGTVANTKRTADGVEKLAAVQRETNTILRGGSGGFALLGF